MTNSLVGEARTFGDWAYIAVEQHFRKILEHEATVIKDKDPEALHQMRVGMRRLRSAIAGFGPALDLPKAVKDKKIGKIARTLGGLRDLDVLQMALTEHYLPSLPESEQEILGKALQILQKQRRRALKNVRKTLKGNLYKKFKQQLQGWLKAPQYPKLAQIDIQLVLSDLLLPEISRLLLHPGWLIGVKVEDTNLHISQDIEPETVRQLLSLEETTLHDLRKEAKRARYQLDLFTQFYGEDYQDQVKTIKDIQTILGEIQDYSVLTEFLNHALDKDWPTQLPHLAAEMSKTRYLQYRQWQELQQKFLHSATRKEIHQIIEGFTPEIVLEKDAETVEEKVESQEYLQSNSIR